MIRVLGRVAAVTAALSLAACAGEQADPASEPTRATVSSSSSAPTPTTDSPAVSPEVVTFGGYGSIKSGMTTVAEVLAMPGWTVGHDREHTDETCAMNNASGVEVSFTGIPPEWVMVIRTPKGTLTDRGVGNESTVEEIRAAYAGTGVNVSDPVASSGDTAVVILTNGEGRQIVFDFNPQHGPAVEGGSGEHRCLPGAPAG